MRLGMGMSLYDLLRRVAAGEPASTLLDGLVSYWALDETSGIRADSVGENDLTDNNTVGYSARGPSGTVASFLEANSESLTCTATIPQTYTMAAWLRVSGADVSGPAFSTKNGVLGQISLNSEDENGSYFPAFSMYDGVEWCSLGEWVGPANTKKGWLFAVATCDNTAKVMKFYVDGLEIDGVVAGHPSAFTGSAGNFAAADLVVFGDDPAHVYPFADTANWDPLISRAAIWSRVLTSDERISLFNSGNGKAYADLTAAEKVGLVSYWNLDEESGTRADSHGSNDLTDNNTVGSATAAAGAMHNIAASFVAANGEYLSRNNVTYDVSLGWTAAAWVKLKSVGAAYRVVFNKGLYTPEFQFYNYTTYFNADVWDIGGAAVSVNTASLGPLSADTWYLLLLWYDPADRKARISLNNGTVKVSGALPQAHRHASSVFQIGGSGGGNLMDGYIDEAAVWSRVLTEDERTELYALGAGKYYPFEG